MEVRQQPSALRRKQRAVLLEDHVQLVSVRRLFALRLLTAASAAGLITTICLSACMPQAPTSMARNDERDEIDPWDQIPKTAAWVHVTGGYGGDHVAECKQVLDWVKGEHDCKGSLCRHARDLTGEWLTRCRALQPVEAKPIDEQYKVYQLRAIETATECGRRAEDIVARGCGNEDKTCQRTVEIWGTQCGVQDSSPLVSLILERTVERKSPSGTRFLLDPRDCDALRVGLVEGARCTQRQPCEQAQRKASTYQRRCEEGLLPSMSTALLQASIAGGAEYAPRPIAFYPESPAASPKEFPALTADGSAAVLYVCDQRVLDAPTAYEERKRCRNGKMMLAKAFFSADGGAEVRIGQLDFVSDADFRARFPALLVDGEAALRDKQESAAFAAELTQISKQSPADALPAFISLMRRNVHAIERSTAYQNALRARDEGLIGVMRELGRRKAAANTPKTPALDLLGLGNRAARRPFADVAADGSLAIGEPTASDELEPLSYLPRAMDAYSAAAKPLVATARRMKIDDQTVRVTQRYANEQANLCAEAMQTLEGAEQGLMTCAFNEPCSSDKIDILRKQADDARQAAGVARHQFNMAAFGPAFAVLPALEASLSSSGCEKPWW